MKEKLNKYFLGYWISTALVLGILIHFFSILTMPFIAPANAWSRLKNSIAVNHMTVLPALSEKQKSILPMLASDVHYAVCRYDISNGPVLITAEIPNDLWSVALYTKHGDNFDLIKGSDLKLNLLRIKLFKKQSNPGVDEHIRFDNQKTAIKDERSIDVLENTGIVVIRAPLADRAFSREALAYLSNATCNQLKATNLED